MTSGYADPPVIDASVDAKDRLKAGRERRREAPRREVLAGLAAAGIPVLLAGPSARVVPVRSDQIVADPGVVMDLVDVDDMLPGSFDTDLRHALAFMSGGCSPRQRGEIAHALGYGYAQAIALCSTVHVHALDHAVRDASRRWAARVLKRPATIQPWDFDTAIEEFVDRAGTRLRHGRLRHAFTTEDSLTAEIVRQPPGWETEWRHFLESVSDADAHLLRWYTPVDVVEVDDDLVVLAHGVTVTDAILLHARAVGPSPLEQDLGIWRQGSDVQRVLVARSRVPLVSPSCLGWTTTRDGSVGRVWSRLRWGRRWTSSKQAARLRIARTHGRVLGLSHARTGDVHELRGYVGNATAFARAFEAAAAAAKA